MTSLRRVLLRLQMRLHRPVDAAGGLCCRLCRVEWPCEPWARARADLIDLTTKERK